MKWILYVSALVVLVVLVSGVAAAEEKVKVAALSTILGDFARQVGGERVEVVDIVQRDVDPHFFEPSPGDVRVIAGSQVVLACGMGFEGYLTKLQESVGDGPRFVVPGDKIKPLMVEESCGGHDHDHGHSHSHAEEGGKVPDPHWWHSIANAKAAVREIRDGLVAVDAAGKAVYDANAKAYMKELDGLEKWVKAEVAKLPRAKRVLVTSHDALGYFARDYGFVVMPVQGISTTDQPSSQKVRELITSVKEKGVKAIFAENIENPKVLTEITRETGAKLGGTLYVDGLGRNTATTYQEMMRHNVATIVSALQ